MINSGRIRPSLVFDVTAMSLRLIPRGRVRTYRDGNDLYNLFCSLYRDVHPSVECDEFIEILKVIFPVYKNPRKRTNEFKITTFGLDETLATIGVKNFPIQTFVEEGVLKIEM